MTAHSKVEPVVLDHYSEDELAFDGGLVRPMGSGFLVQAGAGEGVTFLPRPALSP